MIHLSSNIKFLRGKLGITAQVLADKLKVTRGTVTNYENEVSVPDVFTCEKLAEIFNVNLTDLLTTKLSSQDTYPHMVNEPVVNYAKKSDVIAIDLGDRLVMNVPLVNQYAYAGYPAGYADIEYIEKLPKIPWIVEKEHRGTYRCFEVRGDSMYDGSVDSYKEHDLVLCREIGKQHWPNKLHIKKWSDFIIVHRTDGILLKQIAEHDTRKGEILLHSLNHDYADKWVQLDDVLQIYNVVKVERKK